MKFKTAFSIFCLCSSFSILPLAFFLDPNPLISKSKEIEPIVLEKEYSSQNCSLLHPKGEFLVCRVSNDDSRANFYLQQSSLSLKDYWDRIQAFEMLSRDERNGEITLKLYLASEPDKAITYKTKKFPQIFFVSFKKNQKIIPEEHCTLELSRTTANLSCTTEDKIKRESASAQIIFSRR